MNIGQDIVQTQTNATVPKRTDLDRTIDAIGDALREINDPVFEEALLRELQELRDKRRELRDQRRKELFRVRLFPAGRPRRPGGAA